jgi:hypothetical protein
MDADVGFGTGHGGCGKEQGQQRGRQQGHRFHGFSSVIGDRSSPACGGQEFMLRAECGETMKTAYKSKR